MTINKTFVDDMILGSSLGDGYVNKKLKTLSFTQNSKDEKEKNYINLKYNLIKKYYKTGTVRNTHNNTYTLNVSSTEKDLIEKISNLTRYENNNRKIPDIEYITPVVLLFWYLDDGSLSVGIQKRPNGRKPSISRRLKISLSSYNDKDILTFIEAFKKRYNIEFKPLKEKGKIRDISLKKKEEIAKFLDLILPYKEIIPKEQWYKFCFCDTTTFMNLIIYVILKIQVLVLVEINH
jgi:hypothetical protein